MSARPEPQVPRLEALLVDRATQGLAPTEEAELRELLKNSSEHAPGLDDFDLAAAAIQLASPVTAVPMPAAIEARVRERAQEFFQKKGASPPVDERMAKVLPGPPASPAKSGGRGVWKGLGWLAAAACLALAVLGWWPRLEEARLARQAPPPVTDPAPAPPPSEVPEVPEDASPGLDAESVAAAEDALVLAWTATEDPTATGATGEVIWSNELQAGFMRFEGLESNDPGEFQYQLWIFDSAQDERYPIDGGVFDVKDGETVVPIDPKLGVVDPTLFAVTVEKPGGVVVSSRERIALVAQPAAQPA